MLLQILLASVIQTSACPDNYALGQPPTAQVDQEICIGTFAVGYSKENGEPLFSAQYETPQSITLSKQTARSGEFHKCDQLPDDEQISPDVYAHSGYDLGHMTESGSQPIKPPTFGTCNMVPQAPNLNRLVWAGIEASLRNLAYSGDDLYIVTGPVLTLNPQKLNNQVSIPIATFKAVFDVTKQASEAWVCTNTQTPMPTCKQENIISLEQEINFDPFPKVSYQIKSSNFELPPPTKGSINGQ